ncbi:MAG: hypothetical protein IJ589_08535 [Lachnospiraceae bacterium]|nr:hypothetical protein [Lachnospiraceae bacterium]
MYPYVKERHIINNIKEGGLGGGWRDEDSGMIVVKLEGHIKGKQADANMMLLETQKNTPEYKALLEKLKELEKKNGFVYDLSPTYIHEE